MARFTDLRSDAEEISNVKDSRDLVNRAFNRCLQRIASSFLCPYYLDEGFFSTVDDYSTGTVSVTNGSATVTGSGTTFAASMVGRKFRVGSENAYYRIAAFVSTTEITLEQNYQGSTASGSTYSIYQDEYRLRADVHIPHFLRQIEEGWALHDIDPGDFDIFFPTPTAMGDPVYSAQIGTRRDTYSTGTITGTATGTTITGSSTAWTGVNGLSRGSRIRVGSAVFTVRSVDSDTQLTIYETIVTSFTASAYTIFLDNIRVLLHSIPDAARNIYYRFYREPAPLINDYDEPDLPSDWQWILLPGTLIELWDQKGDLEKSQAYEVRFQRALAEFKSNYRSPIRTYQRHSQLQGRHLFQPRFPAGTDIRAHAP